MFNFTVEILLQEVEVENKYFIDNICEYEYMM